MILQQSIKQIRTMRGLTMAEFGKLLGCTQPTVSRYERGVLVPSRSVLLLLFSLAEGEARDAILAELRKSSDDSAQMTSDTLLDSFAKFQQYLVVKGAGPMSSPELPEVSFAKAAVDALTGHPRPISALLGILELWNSVRDIPGAHRCFEDARVYITVETAAIRASRSKVTV